MSPQIENEVYGHRHHRHRCKDLQHEVFVKAQAICYYSDKLNKGINAPELQPSVRSQSSQQRD